MEKIIINSSGDEKYDSKMEKSRALLKDNMGNIYVCEMDGSFMLPGGTVDDGENHFITINRELKEELGIEGIPLHELIQVNYYHDGFPRYKQEGFERRLNVVYYYFSEMPIEIDINSSTFSDYEVEHNIKISKYPIEEIFLKISNSSSNKWKKFTDLEMLTILRIFQDRNINPLGKRTN